MKTRLLAATTAVFACTVQAQSSVTIYGIVDAYAQYLDGSSRTARIQSGGLSGSRLGFRGTEDLGGGLKANFDLEAGINVDNGTLGQGGIAFGRQAYVGLSDSWGEVTLGRQLGSLYRLGADFNPFGIANAGPSAQTIGGFAGGYEPFRGAGAAAVPPAAGATGNGGPARIDNSIRYATPVWAGLQGSAIVGLGEVAGGTKNNRIYDLSLGYTSEPFDAYLLYVSDRSQSAASPGDVTTVGLGGTYRYGPYRLLGGAIAVNDKRLANEDGRGYWIGGDYSWGANLVRAEWLRSKPRYGSDNATSALGVGYQYNFRKRTSIYSSITRFTNGANAGVGGRGRANVPLPANLTVPGDGDVSEVVAGIRHVF